MVERSGWFLDIYADQRDGVTLWLLGDDGRRHRLHQHFPVTFYAAGPAARLRALWRYLQSQPVPVMLRRTERRDLFQEKPLSVLSIQVPLPSAQPRLFHQVAAAFPDLTYYDADLQLALRHAAVHNTFPLARCKVVVDADDLIHEIEILDTPWVLDAPMPPLRILRMKPDTDPSRSAPHQLLVHFERFNYRLALQPERPLLVNLGAILKRHDPDL
ncbi:MAG TPA: hypothetical protein VMV80_05670, partial [Anaerolineales bacterium]|nr:hypothetical protein [Anaerolineales bacterium]